MSHREPSLTVGLMPRSATQEWFFPQTPPQA